MISSINLCSGTKVQNSDSENHVSPTFLSFYKVCPVGSYKNSDNGGACEKCSADTYSTVTDSTSCTDCPTGKNTQGQIGQTAQSACGRLFTGKLSQNLK